MSNTVNDLLRRIRALESGTGIGAGADVSGTTGTGGGGTTAPSIVLDTDDHTKAVFFDVAGVTYLLTGSLAGLDSSGQISQTRVGPVRQALYQNRAFAAALGKAATSTSVALECILSDSFESYAPTSSENGSFVAIYEAEMAKRYNPLERTAGYLVPLDPANFPYAQGVAWDHYDGAAITSAPQNTTGPSAWGISIPNGHNADVSRSGDGVIVYLSTSVASGGTGSIVVVGPGGTTTQSVASTSTGTASCSAVAYSIAAPGGVYGSLKVTVSCTGGTRLDVDAVVYCAGNRTAGYQMHRVGHGGWRIQDYINRTELFQYFANVQPQFVTICLGTNDARLDSVDAPTYASRMQTLVDAIRAQYTNPPAIRVMHQPNNDGVAAGGVSTWSTAYRAALRAQCEADGNIAFVDMHEMIGDYTAANDPYGVQSGDGIHPNDAGHHAIGQALAAHTILGPVPTATKLQQRFTDIKSLRLSGGGMFRLYDAGTNSPVLQIWKDSADANISFGAGLILGTPTIAFGPGGSTAADLLLTRSAASTLNLASTTTAASRLSFTDNAATDGEVLIGVANILSSPFSGAFVYANSADTQPVASMIWNGTSGTFQLGPGGSTSQDITLSRTGTAAAKLQAGSLVFQDGTAGDGQVKVAVAGLGLTGVAIYGNTADTQAKMSLFGTQLNFGPGGSSATDTQISRSGTAALSVTGSLALTNALILNRVTKTATYTTLATDCVVECTANTFTVTMCATNTAGQLQIISNSGAGTITVAANTGKTLNGPTSVATKTAQRYVGDGSGNWAAA